MKLAEALLLRADLQKKLASLRSRIINNSVVQEGNDPHEDPSALTKEAFIALDELQRLVLAINDANHSQSLADGRSLATAIAERTTLTARHALLQQAIDGSHKEPDRYSMSEIKWVATVDVAGLQQQSEKIAKDIRQLNVAIQERNWQVTISG